MKRWESAIAIAIPLVTVIGAFAVLFYRVDASEKTNFETKAKFAEELREVRTDIATEKVRSTETRESLIRIEEQVKSVRQTVESIDRRQRFSTSTGN